MSFGNIYPHHFARPKLSGDIIALHSTSGSCKSWIQSTKSSSKHYLLIKIVLETPMKSHVFSVVKWDLEKIKMK
jgi:hypothetical protein